MLVGVFYAKIARVLFFAKSTLSRCLGLASLIACKIDLRFSYAAGLRARRASLQRTKEVIECFFISVFLARINKPIPESRALAGSGVVTLVT